MHKLYNDCLILGKCETICQCLTEGLLFITRSYYLQSYSTATQSENSWQFSSIYITICMFLQDRKMSSQVLFDSTCAFVTCILFPSFPFLDFFFLQSLYARVLGCHGYVLPCSPKLSWLILRYVTCRLWIAIILAFNIISNR